METPRQPAAPILHTAWGDAPVLAQSRSTGGEKDFYVLLPRKHSAFLCYRSDSYRPVLSSASILIRSQRKVRRQRRKAALRASPLVGVL